MHILENENINLYYTQGGVLESAASDIFLTKKILQSICGRVFSLRKNAEKRR